MMKKLSIVFSFIALLLSCATITSPSGGEKDTNPPQLLSATPEIGTTNFSKNSFELKFDEYISQIDFVKEILVSPEINTLRSTYLGKKVKFSWKEELKANTTYTFQFLNYITDFNEKNILPGFLYTFSTGDLIDSLSVSGEILNSTYEPSNELNVNLVSKIDYTDSTYIEGGFNFATISDKAGHFNFRYLPLDEFYIYGYEDLNANKKWDQLDERIAFFPHTIESSDSTHVSFELFIEDRLPVFTHAKHSGFNRIELLFENEMPNTDLIELFSYNEKIPFEKLISNDKVELVFNQMLAKDSLCILANNDTLPLYTVKYRVPEIEMTVETPNIINREAFVLKSNYPIHYLDTSKVLTVINGDSLIDHHIQLLEDKYTIEIAFNYSELPVSVVLKDSALLYQDSIYNVPFNHAVVRKSLEDFSIIQCQFKEHTEPLIIQLHSRDDELIAEKYLNAGETSIAFERILPGQYMLRYIVDEDMNGKFTSGSIKQLRQPEKKVIYKGDLQLKPNWITEIVFP